MKKILFIGLSLFLLVPSLVKADMSAPVMTYQVVVNKVSGATLYDYTTYEKVDKTIPYGEKLNIINEKVVNGKVYGSINYDGKYYSILLDETEFFAEEYNLENALKLKEPAKVIIYGDYNSYLYKGPSKVYGKVSDEKIPVGTILEYSYIGNSEGLPSWVYVTYNGTSGWLYIYTIEDSYSSEIAKVGNYNSTNDKILTISDINLKKEAKENAEKLNITIPINTEIEYEYYFMDSTKTKYYYVTYNGVQGWLSNNDIATSLNANIKYNLKNDVKGYSIPNKTSESTVITKDSKLKYLYSASIINIDENVYEIYKYIEIDGKKYWVLEKELDDEIISNTEEKNDETLVIEANDKHKNKITPFQLIYICIGVAALLSLVSVLIIKLINKKEH